jgi:hypothetical protein
MVPCAVSWCVALTDKTFCPIHEKNQGLHPAEVDDDADDDEDEDIDDDESDDEDENEGEDDE